MSDGEEWKGEPDIGDYAAERSKRDPFWMGYFILDANNNPVPVADFIEWARWFQASRKHVDQTLVGERIWVSTVFLGLDHSFARYTGLPHTPVLWETMSFWEGEFHPSETVTCELGGETHSYERTVPLVQIPDDQERYDSLAKAKRGHKRHIAVAERVLAELDAKNGAGFGKAKQPKP